VMGILFAIATYSWQNVKDGKRVTSAANQLSADMRLAHTSATNQLADWRLDYKANGATFACGPVPDADYCLVKLGPGGAVVERIPRTLPDGTTIRGTNLSDTAGLLVGSDRSLEFNPDGSAEVVGGAFAGSGAEPNPTVRVGSSDANSTPSRISVVLPTSRVQIVG
ncbi:MAG: hypothetical protein M3P49_11480, partial [Actinomycetota bacterium]|nr:hypothetical protein [Actinomycetota bacterium]